jgi:copper homeostasis protein
MPLLEVIVCSVADAVEAERGGAGRLEIVRDLHQGGLTPSLELVREIKLATELPVRTSIDCVAPQKLLRRLMSTVSFSGS